MESEDQESEVRRREASRRKLRERVYTVVFMMVLGAFFAAIVGAAQGMFADRIAVNEHLMQQRRILEALRLIPYEGGTKLSGKEIQDLYTKRVKEVPGPDQEPLYLGLSEDGKTVEYVGVLSVWQGFWGRIRGVFTVTPKDRRLWGFSVITHGETPGLGARMTEPPFRKQFYSGALKVPEAAASGASKERLKIDGITGATRTTESIDKYLNTVLPEIVDKLPEEAKSATGPAKSGGKP